MVRMSDHEDFLSADMLNNGDIVEILNEGKFLEAEETPFKRSAFQIDVRLQNGSKKVWTMNKTTRKRLAAAYGDDSKEWVGRRVRVEILKQTIRGELKNVIYGHPVPSVEKETITDPTKAKPKLTEQEMLKGLAGLSEEEKKKYVDTLKAAGLL